MGFGSTEREGYFEREQHLHHHGTLWGLVPQRERERVTLRENNTFIITAHCGVWFQRERERVTLRENNTFIITAHCGVWFHRERERELL